MKKKKRTKNVCLFTKARQLSSSVPLEESSRNSQCCHGTKTSECCILYTHTALMDYSRGSRLVKQPRPLLKPYSEGESARLVGRLFHSLIVCWKKLAWTPLLLIKIYSRLGIFLLFYCTTLFSVLEMWSSVHHNFLPNWPILMQFFLFESLFCLKYAGDNRNMFRYCFFTFVDFREFAAFLQVSSSSSSSSSKYWIGGFYCGLEWEDDFMSCLLLRGFSGDPQL